MSDFLYRNRIYTEAEIQEVADQLMAVDLNLDFHADKNEENKHDDRNE